MTDFRHNGNIYQLTENKLQAFKLHAETVVEFNHWLAAGPALSIDREVLSVLAMELLFDLLEQWSTHNNTLYHWTNAESKDFGNVIFIHACHEPLDMTLHIGMNEEGIYLEVNARLLEDFSTVKNFLKGHIVQLSELGDFTLAEDYDYFCIMWPYSRYSVTEVLTNGTIAFEIMYVLAQQ
jgi:hypothetical protein